MDLVLVFVALLDDVPAAIVLISTPALIPTFAASIPTLIPTLARRVVRLFAGISHGPRLTHFDGQCFGQILRRAKPGDGWDRNLAPALA